MPFKKLYIKLCLSVLCVSASLWVSAENTAPVDSLNSQAKFFIKGQSRESAATLPLLPTREAHSETMELPHSEIVPIDSVRPQNPIEESQSDNVPPQQAQRARQEQTSQQVQELAIEQTFAPEQELEQTQEQEKESFVPDSKKALWYAALCPGLGQIYNRRYWKLPIVAGGIVGVSYAISWNGKYYEAYTYAYRDLIDNDPNTNYFNELIPPGAHYSESQMQTLFKNRQQSFRRQRDLSIIVGVGFYLFCLLDAYVDAELFNFDISDNLSFQWGGSRQEEMPQWREPHWLMEEPQSLNLSFSLHF